MNAQLMLFTKDVRTVLALKSMILLCIIVVLHPAQAFSSDTTWEFSLGAGGYISNVYYGSEEMYAVPFPDVRAAYTKGNFSSSVSFLDGIRVTYSNPATRLTGSIAINGGDERDSEKYKGLGVSVDHTDKVKRLLEGTPTVSTSVRTEVTMGCQSDVGIFGVSLEYHPTVQKSKGERERAYNGFLSTLSYMKPVSVTNQLTVTGMLGIGLMDQNYAEAWYSVEQPTQALKAFDAGAGLRDLQLVVQVDYKFSEHIGATFLAGNAYLLMDAGESPYTTARYQLTSGIYGIYTF